MPNTARHLREVPLRAEPPRAATSSIRPIVVAGLVVLAVTTVTVGWFALRREAAPPSSQAAPEPAASQAAPAPALETNAATPPTSPVARQHALAPPAVAASGGATIARGVAGRSRVTTGGAFQGQVLAAEVTVPPPAAPAEAQPVDEVIVIPVPKAGEGPVLSRDDPGVAPPTLVSPRLTSPLQEQPAAPDLSAIDIVIAESGDVESVKLATPARDYREAMMLSTIKAWRFKPATVGGCPVRYRMRVYISVTTVATGIR